MLAQRHQRFEVRGRGDMENSRYKYRAFVDGNMQYDVSFIEQLDGKIILVSPNGYNIVSQNGDVAIVETEFISSNPILMQYTGLKDKNGVEVFQKDILGGYLSEGYIDKCDKCYSFQYFLKDLRCMHCQGNVRWSRVVESILDGGSWVIGNVYQHPELLTQAKG